MTDVVKAKNCFAAMFDIIGFKALREQLGTNGLYQRYVRGVLPGIHHSAAGSGKHQTVNGMSAYFPDFSESSVNFHVISDTVIFHTRDDSFSSFLSIIHSSFMLLQFGFSGLKDPYKGAIGYGDLIHDNQNILIGGAIEDAYLGESMQTWAGAMLTSACREFATSAGYLELFPKFHNSLANQQLDERTKRNLLAAGRRLVESDVPTQMNPKDGPAVYSTCRTHAIDWTFSMYVGAAEKSFEPSPLEHARMIAANTIAFEDWARKNNGIS